jgi:hypothetical protein
VHPTHPAPHALQDGSALVWVGARARFIQWPGGYFPYEPVGAPIREYARGAWWIDPLAKSCEQDVRLFGSEGESTGCLYGGVFDEVNNHLVAFGDQGSEFVCKRWDVNSGDSLPALPFTVVRDPARPAAYFARSQYVKIGRKVYIVGYRTDGDVNRAPLLLCWNLDSKTMTELAQPPTGATPDLETRLGTSNGKVVWPVVSGPEGEINGIAVYNPATDTWAVDLTVPDYGAFIGNMVVSLPDGRVGWSGGAFGRQPTHLWFYRAD